MTKANTTNLKPIRRIVSNYYMNVEKIHPLKQKLVEKIRNYSMTNENIKSIIIFGSSVTDRCHSFSDLDIYFDLKKNDNSAYKYIYSLIDENIDYWDNFRVDSRMLNEIMKEGVKVYEQKN